jgi:hypothetical protein
MTAAALLLTMCRLLEFKERRGTVERRLPPIRQWRAQGQEAFQRELLCPRMSQPRGRGSLLGKSRAAIRAALFGCLAPAHVRASADKSTSDRAGFSENQRNVGRRSRVFGGDRIRADQLPMNKTSALAFSGSRKNDPGVAHGARCRADDRHARVYVNTTLDHEVCRRVKR